MRGMVKYTTTIAVAAALTIGLSACSRAPEKQPQQNVQAASANFNKDLYEADVQYVRVVNSDVPGVANEHPFNITTDNMRTILSSIFVTETVLFNERQSPLLAPSELQILSTALASGLSNASAGEDVVFVTLGVHPGTLAKERQVNSARVFIKNGRLNMIFGKVHEQYRDKDQYTGQAIDRRVNPLLPGTRKQDSEPNVHIALDNGQAYHIDPETGNERSDWIEIDIPTVLAAAAERSDSEEQGFVTPELREDIARNKQEIKNLREDISNMKEILFEMSDKLDKR